MTTAIVLDGVDTPPRDLLPSDPDQPVDCLAEARHERLGELFCWRPAGHTEDWDDVDKVWWTTPAASESMS